jgi:glycerol-3-phosphate acyltransferase PlsX
LKGIVVKSHGGADARGFAAAIRLASDLAMSDFAAEIDRNLNRLTAAAAGAPANETQEERNVV